VTVEKHLGQRSPKPAGLKTRNHTYISPPPPIPISLSQDMGQNTGHNMVMQAPGTSSELPTIGRAPVHFAGVTNGESLWALPTQESPEASSDSNSVLGQSSVSISGSGTDDLMADIDWVAFDALFPPNQPDSLEYQPEFSII